VTDQGSGGLKRDATRERTADAWLSVWVNDDHIEEDEIPLKRKWLSQSSKGKQALVV